MASTTQLVFSRVLPGSGTALGFDPVAVESLNVAVIQHERDPVALGFGLRALEQRFDFTVGLVSRAVRKPRAKHGAAAEEDANVLLSFGFRTDPSDLPPAACFPEGADCGDTDSQDDLEELLVREADDFAVEELASPVPSAGGEEEPGPPPLPPPAAPAPVAPEAMPPPDVALPLVGLMS